MKPDLTAIPAPEFPDTTRKTLTTKQKLEIMVRLGACVICNKKLTTLAETEFHHSGVGKWAGGSDELENFGPSHKVCNREEGKREAALALKADKMGGFKGQAARRAKNGPKLKSGPTKWPSGRKIESRKWEKKRD